MTTAGGRRAGGPLILRFLVYISRNSLRVSRSLVITVDVELEYFLNEETEGVLTYSVMNFHDWHLSWLSQLKPNVKVLHWDSPLKVVDELLCVSVYIKLSPFVILYVMTVVDWTPESSQ